MTIKEAFDYLNALKEEYNLYWDFVAKDPYHTEVDAAHRAMATIRRKMECIEEAIYKTEITEDIGDDTDGK